MTPDPGSAVELLAIRNRISNAVGDRHKPSDIDLAAVYVHTNRDTCRYVHQWGKWLVYKGGRWHVDYGDVYALGAAGGIRVAIDALLSSSEAAQLGETDREWLVKAAQRSGSVPNMERAMRLARRSLVVDHDALDPDPDLLNVANGTVDLRTGQLRPHDPADLITKLAPVDYDPAARSALWDEALSTWQPDHDMRRYLQAVAGSAATGHAVQHLFINHGGGGNGKSAFYGATQHVLGDYCVTADKSLLVRSKYEPHPTVKAALFGARMVLAAETNDAAWLADDSVKELTGGDRINGRRMREDAWSFVPTWTAFLHTNHKPRVRGGDVGVWRRLRLIPWDQTIPPEQRDDRLPERLREQAPAVLAWLCEGARRWLADNRFTEPTAVADATREYQGESDLVRSFLASAGFELAPGRVVTSYRLTEAHTEWCDDQGLEHKRQWYFTARGLKELGAEPVKARGERCWSGLREV